MNEELYHYGKIGMKWGRRKGPSMRSVRIDRVNTQRREMVKSITKHKVYDGKTPGEIARREDKARVEANSNATNKMLKKIWSENYG